MERISNLAAKIINVYLVNLYKLFKTHVNVLCICGYFILTFEKYRFPGVELDTTSCSILSLRRVLLDKSTPPSLLCKKDS